MPLHLTRVRLRAVWLLVPVFLLLARPTPRLLAAGAAIALLGAAIRAWAAGTLRKNVELTTHGAYAHSRNPLYLGSFFIGIGVTIAGGHPLFLGLFLLFFVSVYGVTMRREAHKLEGLYGQAYRDYAASVPILFPRLTPYRPGAGPSFQLSRYVANREYQAALGILAGLLALWAKLAW
jgi:protein-S-isoprenylcysteine O-methyltransferase Ste14